jgi:hypothetical protein
MTGRELEGSEGLPGHANHTTKLLRFLEINERDGLENPEGHWR